MSIQSTASISRTDAENRILEIINKIINADWIELENDLNEDDYFRNNFINYYNDIFDDYHQLILAYSNISRWPIFVLEDFMDKPGVRFSMFENYRLI